MGRNGRLTMISRVQHSALEVLRPRQALPGHSWEASETGETRMNPSLNKPQSEEGSRRSGRPGAVFWIVPYQLLCLVAQTMLSSGLISPDDASAVVG